LQAQTLLAKALEFTRRAEDATDNEVRDYFYRLRDVWVKAANDQGLFDGRQCHRRTLPDRPHRRMN
jgi:hypothetical protein